MLSALTRFMRPHTIIATTIQVFSLFLIAGGSQVLSPSSIGPVLLTLVTCLALNVYVVGLNQITDIEIDQINKPRLPLASHEMTPRQGWIVVVLTGLAALIGGLIAGPYLAATVILIGSIGTLYSVPPFRLKRFSFWAAISIAVARGIIANVGVALHYNNVFGGLENFSVPTLIVLAAFFFGFGLVIAIYKDIPDLMGDKLHGIETFTVKLGPKRALNLGRLHSDYRIRGGHGRGGDPASAAGRRLSADRPDRRVGSVLAGQQNALIFCKNASITRFYMFLWGLFYAQYIVLSVYQVANGLA